MAIIDKRVDKSKNSAGKLYAAFQSIGDCLERSRSETLFIFKHSSTCPISSAAKRQVDVFLEETPVTAYLIVVPQQRPLSNEIAERLGIRHESPQLIALKDGSPTGVLNHYQIVRESIQNLLDS